MSLLIHMACTHSFSDQAAFRYMEGRVIDGRRVVVDVERGRTVPGWYPRRLGGGKGETRNGEKKTKKLPP